MIENGNKNKKSKQSIMTSIVVSVALASTLVLYQNCGGSLKGQEQVSEDIGPDTLGTVPEKVGMTAGINNYESTYSNLKVITGVEDDTCDNVYEEGKASLPQDNNIATVNAGAQSAGVKLAACLCREAINNNSGSKGQAGLLPGVDLNGNPSADMVAQALVNATWGLNNTNVPAGTTQLVAETFDGLLNLPPNQGGGRTTVQAAFGACVTTMGSVGANIL